jgi:hypothetical protein
MTVTGIFPFGSYAWPTRWSACDFHTIPHNFKLIFAGFEKKAPKHMKCEIITAISTTACWPSTKTRMFG